VRNNVYLILLALLVLPNLLIAETGEWIAITRSGDTLHNVYLWSQGDSVLSFVVLPMSSSFENGSTDSLSIDDPSISQGDGRTRVLDHPFGARRVHLSDLRELCRIHGAYFWTGVLIGGGAGITTELIFASQHPDKQYLPFAASVGIVLGGSIGALLSVDEAYDLSTTSIEDIRTIVHARLPRARSASNDGTLVLIDESSPSERMVSGSSLWLVGSLFGAFWVNNVTTSASQVGVFYRRDRQLFGVHYLQGATGDQYYLDLSLHYGRTFDVLGGEAYLSAGPGYAWAEASSTRNDTTQAITQYSTVSASLVLQQQWLVTRWFAFGTTLFVGANTQRPFAGGMFSLTFGDID
jgi:hypothetical protein